jgi:hypothetical protein
LRTLTGLRRKWPRPEPPARRQTLGLGLCLLQQTATMRSICAGVVKHLPQAILAT